MGRKVEQFGVTVEGDISGLKSAMNEAVKVFNSTERSIKNINKALKLDPTNIDLLTERQNLYTKAINDAEKALQDLKKTQTDIEGHENYTKDVGLSEKYTQLQLKIVEVTKELERLKKEMATMPSPDVQKFINQFQTLGDTLMSISSRTRYISMAFKKMLADSFEYAIEYENEIAGIKKIVTDLSDNTIAKLRDIAIDTGSAFKEVSEYATFSGALGLAEDKISKFTKTMIDLNTATGGAFSGELGAKGLVVFLNNLGVSVDEAENFGSAISVIGDAMADVGDETLQMAISLAQLATISDVTQYDIIGLAGVMKNLGLRTATSSNALTKTFMQIETAIATQDKTLSLFAKTANMTSEEFVKAWGENATDAFLRFADGIKSSVFDDIDYAVKNQTSTLKDYADTLGITAKRFSELWNEDSQKVLDKYVQAMEELDDNSENASVILKSLKLSGVRVAETLLKLSGQGDNVREAIQMANSAWKENIALARKSETMYDTTERKIAGMKEAFKLAGQSMLQDFMPTIGKTVDGLTTVAKAFVDTPPIIKKTTLAFMGFGAVLSPMSRSLAYVFKDLSKIASGLNQYTGEAAKAVITTGQLAGAYAAFIAALGMYGYIYITNDELYKLTKHSKELRESFEELKTASDQTYLSQVALLDLSEEYITKINELNEKLKDTTLTEEQRAEMEDTLKGYIDALNDSLDSEVFSFDEATKQIMYQGEKVDDLTGKFQNLSYEIKKGAWLEAHRDSLLGAYDLIESANNSLIDLNRIFSEKIQKIPEEYVNLYEQYGGDIFALQKDLEGIGDDSLEKIKEAFAILSAYDADYGMKVKQYQEDILEGNKLISEYTMVAESTAETFDEVLSNMLSSVQLISEDLTTEEEQLLALKEIRDKYYEKLTDEQRESDTVLQLYNEQIEALEKAYEKHLKIYGETVKEGEVTDNTINKFNTFANTEAHKSLVIDVSYNYTNSPPMGVGHISMPGPFYSGGYGNLRDAIDRTMFNNGLKYSSGGYASGGVTLNANFTINNGNNISRSVVQDWASTMVDIINEELGGRM